MSFSIPKDKVSATLLLEDGTALEVELFLAQPIDGVRTERPSDLLTGVEFIPISQKDGSFRIVRRSAITSLTVRADVEYGGELSVEDLAGGFAKKTDLEVRTRSGAVLKGTVIYLLPEGQQRVQDLLNQPDPLLMLRDGDLVHLLSKTQIVDVRPL